jgi:Helix-turn-helix domain
MPSLAAYPAMMHRSRERLGLRECRAAWLLGITVRQYRALEAGEDTLMTADVWERMIEVFGWPR